MPKMQVACTLPVGAGMVIRTETAQVQAARKSTLEFLLTNLSIDLLRMRLSAREAAGVEVFCEWSQMGARRGVAKSLMLCVGAWGRVNLRECESAR